jgi:hypothetical protein
LMVTTETFTLKKIKGIYINSFHVEIISSWAYTQIKLPRAFGTENES